MLITRSGILRDCLEDKNREMHKYSKHEAGLEPLPGYEQIFEDLRQTCQMLRGMILNAEDRERETRAQTDLASWQMDIIKGQQPGVEMVLRRRYRQEEYKPAPVVYPGGEE